MKHRAPQHLQVHVHQLVLLEDVIDLPRLQPSVRLLLLLLQVDEDAQTALGVVQRGPVGPGIRAGVRARAPGPAVPGGADRALPGARLPALARPAKVREALWKETGTGSGPSCPCPTPRTQARDLSGCSGERVCGQKLRDSLGQWFSNSSAAAGTYSQGFCRSRSGVGPENVLLQRAPGRYSPPL